MVTIKRSKVLNRNIRADALPELGVSTLAKALEAIDAGKTAEARQLVEYLWTEGKGLHDLYADWIWALHGYIAETYGDEALFKAAMASERVRTQLGIDLNSKLSVEEVVQIRAENFRAHRSGPRQMGDVVLKDMGDRYVMECNPCGSGGRMRLGDPVAGTPPRTGPPYNFGVIKKAYPWTWGIAPFPAYCVHCAVAEILTIEIAGCLQSVRDFPEDPTKPCIGTTYKDPKLVPERYYTRLGKTKPKI